MIINKNEAKAMTEIFNVIVNANSIVQHVIQLKNGMIIHVNLNVKIIVHAENVIVGILVHVCICENSKCLKSIADTSRNALTKNWAFSEKRIYEKLGIFETK